MPCVDDLYLYGLVALRMLIHLCDDHAADVLLHIYIQTYIGTWFFSVLISMGLSHAHPMPVI